MQRRSFIKLCGGAAVLLGTRSGLSWADEAAQKTYQRVSIVDANDLPLMANQLAASEGYIFHYPYQSTPVLLIDLGRKVSGGVGPSGGVVAFTAICPHQFAYPTKSLSAINYQVSSNYQASSNVSAGHTQTITCCLHGSAFDPANAGAVLAGPAPRPLTMIDLVENDVTGLSAVGTRGADIYPEFFKAFKRELREQFGRSEYMQEIQGQSRAIAATEYSSQRVNC